MRIQVQNSWFAFLKIKADFQSRHPTLSPALRSNFLEMFSRSCGEDFESVYKEANSCQDVVESLISVVNPEQM